MEVRRRFTDTPLARRLARAHREGRRAPPQVPWSRFDRARYPEPALALARDAYLALAAGEYSAIDLFARLTGAMARNGMPFDLVDACAAIPADELRHTDCALKMAALCGALDRVALDERRNDARWPAEVGLAELDWIMVELPAISETIALALLSACRGRATDPVARAFFATIVADEVHHARLGWYYLAWRAPSWSRAERQAVADRAGVQVMAVEGRFLKGRDAPPGSRRAASALGVLDSATQRAVILRVMEDEIVPALDALGLGASLAWRMRKRAAR